MKNDKIDQIWSGQDEKLPKETLNNILRKANKQRRGQYWVIGIISLTVIILVVYALNFAIRWDDFTLGLSLMIFSLVFRVILEVITLYRKENQLVRLDHRAFKDYLKKHYRMRLGINYLITPLCFGVYTFGFIKLLPYFKTAFSPGFYNYILISGVISLLILAWIIIRSVMQEQSFLKRIRSF